jgi:UDP-glucose:(heptosyl)LPS alpha-1,3-glucosyltransferase
VKLAFICRPLTFHGGVETATAGLARELVRRGHAIDFLTPGEGEAVPGTTVRRLSVVRQPSVIRVLSFALAAKRITSAGAYDVVQSHERTLHQDLYRAGEGSHQAYLAAMGRRAGWNPHHRLVCVLERRIFQLRSARHVVAISRRGKEEIEALYGTMSERLSLIYNGVDLHRFHPTNRARFRGEERALLGVADETWMILFVGSGFERKGLGALLQAFGHLRDSRVRLVVAGRGDVQAYRALAAKLGIGDRVTWTAPRRDVERLYAAADVVALPAIYEPFGNVHLEALASGVPVLTSAQAGGSEAIVSGRNGWVVGAPTGDSIRAGLEALRDGNVARLATAARESAEPFTHAAQADAFETLYRELKR